MILHRPFQRDHVAAGVAHDALRTARGAGGVENIKRVGRGHGLARGLEGPAPRRFHQNFVVVVAALDKLRRMLRALHENAIIGFGGRNLDSLVEQRLVLHDAVRLDAAGGGNNHLRLRVLDADGKLVRGKPAEDDGMDRADARAGEHRDQRLGDHRHIEDDPVALLDARFEKHAAKSLNLVEKLRISVDALLSRDGTIVDQSRLIAPAVQHMAVETVIGRVGDAAREPAAVDALARVEDLRRRFEPVDFARRLRPEALRVALPALINFEVPALNLPVHTHAASSHCTTHSVRNGIA